MLQLIYSKIFFQSEKNKPLNKNHNDDDDNEDDRDDNFYQAYSKKKIKIFILMNMKELLYIVIKKILIVKNYDNYDWMLYTYRNETLN